MENVNIPSAADLFANSGSYVTAFLKNTPVGTMFSGEVTNVEALQVKNYETDELEWWEPGRPKMQMRIVVQTGMPDPNVEGDTGERAIYIKWWGDQRTALMDALKSVGAKSVEVGGKFAAKLMGTKPTEGKNGKALNDAKIFGYQYQKPVQGVDMTQMGEPAAPAQPAQAPQQQAFNASQAQPDPWGNTPQQTTTPAPAPMAQPDPWGNSQPQQASAQPAQAPQQQAPQGNDPVAQARQLIQLGIFPDDQIQAATGLSIEQITALRQQ